MATTKKTTETKSKEVDMVNAKDIGTYDYVKNAYKVYGMDVNADGFQLGRAFCGHYDGLKISYRHMLQTLLDMPDRMVKALAVTSDCIKKYHPHGDASLPEVLYSLANDYNMVLVQGNSGSNGMTSDFGGAAGRYPEAKLRPEVREQLSRLLPHVPEEEDIMGYKEKRYIPTPLPLALIAGSGLAPGVGIRNNIPAFTAKSLYDAYMKNDPTLLRLNFGYSLGKNFDDTAMFDNKTNKITGTNLADSKPSDENKLLLKALWEDGVGKLKLYIPVYNCAINGQLGFMLVCNPKLFKPKISKQLQDWQNDGLIEIFDYSDEIGKLFVSLTPRTKKISLADVQKEVLEAKGFAWTELKYEIKIAYNNVTGAVGMYNWIDFTHHNYEKLYKAYIAAELEKLDFEEICWYNFRAIGDLLMDKKKKYSDKEIVQVVNDKLDKGTKKDQKYKITEKHAAWVGEKAMNTLRNSDPAEKMKKIEDARAKFKNIVIENEIKSFIKCIVD